jgi:alpha-N-arabinofuranosidase
VRTEFDGPHLGPQWVHLRTASTDRWSLGDRRGFLRLKGNAETLDEIGSPAFVARRQEHFTMRAATRVEFEPTADQVAGLVLRQDEANHYTLRITGVEGHRRVELVTRVAGVTKIEQAIPIAKGPVTLQVMSFRDRYEFIFMVGSGARQDAGSAPTAPLSSEKTGGFTGVFIGMFASGAAGATMPAADFAWFDYEALDT